MKDMVDVYLSKNECTPLEVLAVEAKAFEVDVSAAEEAVTEAKAAKEKQDKERIEGKKSDSAKEEEQKKVDARLEAAKKEVEAAGAKAEEAKKASAEAKDSEVKEAETAADGEFTAELKAAIDKALKKMDSEYRKRTFILRKAACDAYLDSTTSGLSAEEGKTISQNDLNKIMNLTDAAQFDAFAKALGFATDSFSEVANEIQLQDEPGYQKEG